MNSYFVSDHFWYNEKIYWVTNKAQLNILPAEILSLVKLIQLNFFNSFPDNLIEYAAEVDSQPLKELLEELSHRTCAMGIVADGAKVFLTFPESTSIEKWQQGLCMNELHLTLDDTTFPYRIPDSLLEVIRLGKIGNRLGDNESFCSLSEVKPYAKLEYVNIDALEEEDKAALENELFSFYQDASGGYLFFDKNDLVWQGSTYGNFRNTGQSLQVIIDKILSSFLHPKEDNHIEAIIA